MFSDIDRKIFVLIATCFQRESENSISFVERIFFWDHIFKKRCNLLFFRRLSRKSSSARRNFSGGIVKAAFYDSRRTMWVYTCSEKLISSLFFWVFVWKNPAILTRVFRQVSRNCMFLCPEEHFRWEIFFIEFTKLYCYSG